MKNKLTAIALAVSLVIGGGHFITPAYAQDCVTLNNGERWCEEPDTDEVILGAILIGLVAIGIWAIIDNSTSSYLAQEETSEWENFEPVIKFNNETEEYHVGMKYTIDF